MSDRTSKNRLFPCRFHSPIRYYSSEFIRCSPTVPEPRMPSVRMGIGIDPHANHLCRLFGFSEIYPIGSHFGSWYISRIIYSILISTEYRKLAALVNLQLWKEKNCKYVNLPSSYYGQILLLILGKSNISYYNYSVPFSLYWASASVKRMCLVTFSRRARSLTA